MKLKLLIRTISFLIICCTLSIQVFAHNGSVAFAYPLAGKITVDGNFSDWPANAQKYLIALHLSDTKPKNETDLSGFFHLGYRLDNQSL